MSPTGATGPTEIASAIEASGGVENACDQIGNFIGRVVPWPQNGAPGYINLHWTSPKGTGLRGLPFTQIDDFMQRARWCATRDAYAIDVYFCLSLQEKVGKVYGEQATAARRAVDALLLKAVWLDIDVKPGEGYATKEEALRALDKFVRDATLPPPTAIIDSGGRLPCLLDFRQASHKGRMGSICRGLVGCCGEVRPEVRSPDDGCCAHPPRPGDVEPKESERSSPPGVDRQARSERLRLAAQLKNLSAHSQEVASTGRTRKGDAPPFDLNAFIGKKPHPLFMALDPHESLADGIYDDRPLDPTEVFRGCPISRTPS